MQRSSRARALVFVAACAALPAGAAAGLPACAAQRTPATTRPRRGTAPDASVPAPTPAVITAEEASRNSRDPDAR